MERNACKGKGGTDGPLTDRIHRIVTRHDEIARFALREKPFHAFQLKVIKSRCRLMKLCHGNKVTVWYPLVPAQLVLPLGSLSSQPSYLFDT